MTMRPTSFAPLLSVLAFAGSTDAGHQAAFDALHGAILQCLKHGNKRPLNDTIEALTEVKGTKARRMVAVVTSALGAAVPLWTQHKGKSIPAPAADGFPPAMYFTPEGAADCIRAAAVDQLEGMERDAAAKRAAAKAARAVKTINPDGSPADGAQDIADTPADGEGSDSDSAVQTHTQASLTVQQCVDFLRFRAAAGDTDAIDALGTLATEATAYFDVAPTVFAAPLPLGESLTH